jgi:hypothetical protein
MYIRRNIPIHFPKVLQCTYPECQPLSLLQLLDIVKTASGLPWFKKI